MREQKVAEKSSRLGRGLAALIGEMATIEAIPANEPGGVRRVPVRAISANRNNPRRDFDEGHLEELSNSIREKGLMQPLLVRPVESDPQRFEIIAGERRWRAAQKAGLTELPVIVREVSDKEALELAIIENVQRADLNPLEEAMGYNQLMEQFSYTQADLAQVIGKSRSHVANTLRLLRLPDDVRAMLARGELTAGHARALITATDPEGLAQRIVDQGLSVREAEALGQEAAAEQGVAPRARRRDKDEQLAVLEKRFSDALGLKVRVNPRKTGGQIEIRYSSQEELDGMLARLAR